MATKKKAEKPEVKRFSKEQLVTFSRYKNQRDILSAVLLDGKYYSFEEVDAEIENFMNKVVV